MPTPTTPLGASESRKLASPTPINLVRWLQWMTEHGTIRSKENWRPYLDDFATIVASEARAHQAEIERLTRELGTQKARAANAEFQRDQLEHERDGLKCTVDCLTANQAGLRSDLKASLAADVITYKSREKLAQQFEEACRQRDRIQRVVKTWVNKWRDRYNIFSPNIQHFHLDALEREVEAAAQPLADEAVGNAGATRPEARMDNRKIATLELARAVQRAQEAIVIENGEFDAVFDIHLNQFVDALIAAVKES